MINKEQLTPLLIGTYTGDKEKDSKGIYRILQNPDNGKLTFDTLLAEISNPTFLAVSPDRKYLFSVEEKGEGFATAFSISDDLALTKINSQPSLGSSPCHVVTDHEQNMAFVSNYSSGVLTVYGVEEDGSLSEPVQHFEYEGKGPHPNQNRAHAHQTYISPNNRFAYVQDLGTDQIHMYRIDLEKKLLKSLEPQSIKLPPGSGPRHMTFHPKLPYAYVICELGSTVHAYKYDGETGVLSEIDHYPSIPDDWQEENYPADIHVSPDGKFLYGSNRGHNSLVIFKINAGNGSLDLVGYESVRGDWPRNFYITRDGKYIYVANQRSNNITTFSRHPGTGKLTLTDSSFTEIAAPVCIIGL